MQRYKCTNQSTNQSIKKGKKIDHKPHLEGRPQRGDLGGGAHEDELVDGLRPVGDEAGELCFCLCVLCVCLSWVQASLMPPPRPPAPCGVHYLCIHIHSSPNNNYLSPNNNNKRPQNKRTHRCHLRHGLVLRGDRRDGGVHLLAQDAVAAILWCMYIGI